MPDTDIKKLLLEVDASVEGLRGELRKGGDDLARFERNVDDRLDGVDRRFSKTGRSVTGIGKNLDSVRKKIDGFAGSLKSAAVALVAAGGLNVIADLIKSGIEYSSTLKRQADALGVSTAALQEYRYAALQAGVEQDALDDGLKELTKRIGEATAGSKRQIAAFDDLGISIRDANGEVRNASDLIPEIANALEGIESPAERATKLIAVFGENGQKLDALLSKGAGGIDNLRNAARELGIVLSEKQIADADETAKKFEQIKLVLQARIAGVVADNADAILEMADALNELAERAIRTFEQLQKLYGQFQQFKNSGLGRLIGSLNTGASYLNPVQNTGRALNYVADRLAPPVPTRSEVREEILNRPLTGSNGILSDRPGPLQFAPTLEDGSIDRRGYGGAGLDGQFSLDSSAGQASVRNFAQVVDVLSQPTEDAAKTITEWSVELDKLGADLAIANAEVTGSLAERAEAEKQRIDADLASDVLRIKADKDLTKAQQDRVVAVQEQIASAKKQLVDQRLDEDLAEERRRADRLLLDQKLNQLDEELRTAEIEADATRDRRARLVLERRILALQQEEEKARLEATIAAGEIRDATRARANLEKRQAIERSEVERENLSPGGAYLDGLRKSAGELNDDLERVATDGLQSLNDGIAEAIVGGESLGKTFSRIADQIIADLLRIAIQQAVIEPLASGLFSSGSGSSGGGGIGGFFKGLAGGLSNLFGSGNSRAIGGPVTAGRPYLVGEKEPEIFVPNANGRIYNPNQIGGGASGGMSVSLTVNAPGATAETVSMIRRELANAAPQIVAAARNATTRELSRKRLT